MDGLGGHSGIKGVGFFQKIYPPRGRFERKGLLTSLRSKIIGFDHTIQIPNRVPVIFLKEGAFGGDLPIIFGRGHRILLGLLRWMRMFEEGLGGIGDCWGFTLSSLRFNFPGRIFVFIREPWCTPFNWGLRENSRRPFCTGLGGFGGFSGFTPIFWALC